MFSQFKEAQFSIDIPKFKEATNMKIIGLLFRSKIFDFCTPFDLIKWKRVCKQWNELINHRFDDILYLDVHRLDTRILLRELNGADGEYCAFDFYYIFPLFCIFAIKIPKISNYFIVSGLNGPNLKILILSDCDLRS